jgi:thymidylate synthase
MEIVARNVNDAFYRVVSGLHSGRIPHQIRPSRNGEVMRIPRVVTLTYERPNERVLLNTARDANPFFHLYESLWMLAGRNDVAPLRYYNSRIHEYSDDGRTFNGAYGYRWRMQSIPEPSVAGERREFATVDQLEAIKNHLHANPESRRAVLSMWNVEDDLLKVDTSKDVCCNLAGVFSVEPGPCRHCNGEGYQVYDAGFREPCPECNGLPHDVPRFLDITVFNRSNDLIWGTLGANAVQFSVLQEYMAAHLDLDVGEYYQVSTNSHAYTDPKRWQPEKWLREYERGESESYNWYAKHGRNLIPLVEDPAAFDRELPNFVEAFSGKENKTLMMYGYSEPFLMQVAKPMMWAWYCYKQKDLSSAFSWLSRVTAEDWHTAAWQWMEIRERRRNKS